MAAVEYIIQAKIDPLLKAAFAQAKRDINLEWELLRLNANGKLFERKWPGQDLVIFHLTDAGLDAFYKSLDV